MNQMKLKSDVFIEDLPDGVWREFVEQHGIEPILGLTEKLGGAMVYIPSVSSILRKSRNRATREGKLNPTLPKKQIERIYRI